MFFILCREYKEPIADIVDYFEINKVFENYILLIIKLFSESLIRQLQITERSILIFRYIYNLSTFRFEVNTKNYHFITVNRALVKIISFLIEKL